MFLQEVEKEARPSGIIDRRQSRPAYLLNTGNTAVEDAEGSRPALLSPSGPKLRTCASPEHLALSAGGAIGSYDSFERFYPPPAIESAQAPTLQPPPQTLTGTT